MSDKNKILIVEDNKTLAKLIAKKMDENVDMQIDVAYNFLQAKEFLENSEQYFVSILDLNLPDAPNGEIVDYVISKKLPIIVLTASIDDETKKSFIHKDIVDYVYKGNIDDINYIFKIINRLIKNRQYKVMVVEDSVPLRNNIKKILQSLQFNVFVAAHGEEAINYFNENPDIKLVISDYQMPVKDGLEILKELRKLKDKNKLGIIMITSPKEDIDAAVFLKNGANDFIAKPFAKEEFICRINNSIESMENMEQVFNFANYDFLTGLANRRFFYSQVSEYFDQISLKQEPFALAMLDIDHFKKINDQYGHDIGDKVIIDLSRQLSDKTKGNDIVARFGGEEFCVILKNIKQEEAIKFFVNLRSQVFNKNLNIKGKNLNFSISVGLVFCDVSEDIDMLLKNADDALYRAKANGRNRVEIG